ncbi:YiiD C-terminal domain-containing protein [Alcanivorax sp.]|jgi:thioesterase domain-containing protein|uniref:YiiD C-terminal domain-containing protein n=1 Tax=Alcanivorax sp. TaxID=1872427 RepID=UPI002B26EAD8|nr:YiiD C-terminal domain-containing protein [Alcanivorax sp.]
MMDLAALAEQVRNAIPLTRHLAFQLETFDGQALTLTAPLAVNHNDKGTFFAGSQSALLTLAGWSLTTLLARQAGVDADVVAVKTGLEYQLPLNSDIHITATAGADDISRFEQRLTRRGKATLTVLAQGTSANGAQVCEYQGLYLAKDRTP